MNLSYSTLDIKLPNSELSLILILKNQLAPSGSEFTLSGASTIILLPSVISPEIGKVIEQNNQAAVVESTKAASDVYSPISGEVTEGNKAIVDDPSIVNSDPEGASWFFKIKIKNISELDSLMTKSDYDKFVAENPS